MKFYCRYARIFVLVTALLMAATPSTHAGQSRRSLQLPTPAVAADKLPSEPPGIALNVRRKLSRPASQCFVFVHDVAKKSTDPYDQRHYFVALTNLLDELLRKWRFDKVGGCGSVLFLMLTTDKTYYGELAEIELVALQSVDNRSFDSSDADLARTTDIVFLKDLYRRIRFDGQEQGSPIYAALNEFLDTGYHGIVNLTEPAFEAARREGSKVRGGK